MIVINHVYRYNMQKVTYVLLQRHANNYWQTERDDDTRSGTYLLTEIFKI